MPLVAEDLLAPRGELQPALLATAGVAGQAGSNAVADWLQTGYDNATAAGFTDDARLDRIARAYAYWRAYDAAVQLMAANPMSVSFADKGSSSYSTEQLRTLQAKASRWEGDYTAAIAPDATPSGPTGPGSGVTSNIFVW